MKYKEYKKIIKEYPIAIANFKKYRSSGGTIRKFAIDLSLYLGFIPGIRSLPVLSWLIGSANGLIFGHISENLSTNQKNLNYQNLSTKLLDNSRVPRNELWDYVIIGSGPGAAVAVNKINPNKNVLVIESGNQSKIPNSLHHSFIHLESDFYRSGQELILAYPLAQFAQGKVLGGGSEVNSGLYHKLPDIKIEDFLSDLRISEKLYKDSESKIEKLLEPELSRINESNSLIARGAKSLGLNYANIPRWRHYKEDGSYLQKGMDILVWNKSVSNSGFQLLLNSEVVYIDNTKKDYIKISYVNNTEGKKREVKARNVIVAAGTINTPYLLAKSRIISWSKINFQWHPMLRTIVKTRENDLGFNDIDPVQAWNDDFTLKLGSAVSTPGLLAVNLKQILDNEKAKTLRSYYVSFVSSGVGGLIPKTRTPWYRYSKTDMKYFESGAKLLQQIVREGEGKFLDNTIPVKPTPSTVHIFGTLPASSKSYIEGTCQLIADSRIYVADGSLLPFGPGVNPQAIIMSTVQALFSPGE